MSGEVSLLSGDLSLSGVDNVSYDATGDGAIVQFGDAELATSDESTAGHIATAFNDLGGTSLNPSSWATPAPTPAQYQVYGPFQKMRKADGSNFWQDPNTGEEFDPDDYPEVSELSPEEVIDAIDQRTGPDIEYSGRSSESEFYAETFADLGDEVMIDGSGVVGALRDLGSSGSEILDADAAFSTNAPGNREAEFSLSVYDSGAYEDRIGSVLFEDEADVTPFLNAVAGSSIDARDYIEGSASIEQARQDSRTRRELRNQLDSALESAGYDDDEWNTGARADGTLILQDPETNRTRTIEAGDDLDSTVDSFGGDSDVQPESDDGGSGEQGGGGLDRRAIGAGLIVAAAAAYGVLQK